jgi:hypothetical protein
MNVAVVMTQSVVTVAGARRAMDCVAPGHLHDVLTRPKKCGFGVAGLACTLS